MVGQPAPTSRTAVCSLVGAGLLMLGAGPAACSVLSCAPICRVIAAQHAPHCAAAVTICPSANPSAHALQIQQIIDAIAKAGDQNATARWEAQLTACNITYTQPTNGASAYGSVLLPLVVMAASVALVELLRP